MIVLIIRIDVVRDDDDDDDDDLSVSSVFKGARSFPIASSRLLLFPTR